MLHGYPKTALKKYKNDNYYCTMARPDGPHLQQCSTHATVLSGTVVVEQFRRPTYLTLH